jgi:hypothetical protein
MDALWPTVVWQLLVRLGRFGSQLSGGLSCLCEKVAVMETAIGASLSHPNIVQVGFPPVLHVFLAGGCNHRGGRQL